MRPRFAGNPCQKRGKQPQETASLGSLAVRNRPVKRQDRYCQDRYCFVKASFCCLVCGKIFWHGWRQQKATCGLAPHGAVVSELRARFTRTISPARCRRLRRRQRAGEIGNPVAVLANRPPLQAGQAGRWRSRLVYNAGCCPEMGDHSPLRGTFQPARKSCHTLCGTISQE